MLEEELLGIESLELECRGHDVILSGERMRSDVNLLDSLDT